MKTEPLHIFTDRYFLGRRAVYWYKRLRGRHMRGPLAVERSLLEGLLECSQPFEVNKKPVSAERIGVLSGVPMLQRAISWKQSGLVKKIIAGPNLVVTPDDHGGIIRHPLIDMVLQPSQWSADFYASLAPELLPKLRVWPAGVHLAQKNSAGTSIDFLIFNKIGAQPLVAEIAAAIAALGYSYRILTYGSFRQQDYFFALSQSRFLVYLSESESQGLAMFEAWARDVPVMVWERGFWQYKNYSWRGRTASSYVCPENGMTFADGSDFRLRLKAFTETAFQPRRFIEQSFTCAKSAQQYAEFYFSA